MAGIVPGTRRHGYAEASGLPAIYGLYATIVPLVADALVGPSRILVLGPNAEVFADRVRQAVSPGSSSLPPSPMA